MNKLFCARYIAIQAAYFVFMSLGTAASLADTSQQHVLYFDKPVGSPSPPPSPPPPLPPPPPSPLLPPPPPPPSPPPLPLLRPSKN